MAFRKRNVAVNKSSNSPSDSASVNEANAPGVRPSFLTSQPTTSTGCSSLDSLLGGHGGLALGSSLLLGESGTTDYAGALLKYYAAEGICQGHVIHVVGMGDGWVRDLPGVAEERRSTSQGSVAGDEEKMKIAWRYERLGQAGERALPDRSSPSSPSPNTAPEEPFCHAFDLTKRLPIPPNARINNIPIPTNPHVDPFDSILARVQESLRTSSPNDIHRLIIPTILSPALYPPHASDPPSFLRFLHTLRHLLRRHPAQLTALITLPLTLHPRTRALTRWAEVLADGVLELTPFPHLMDQPSESSNTAGGARKDDEQQPQGMLKVHKVPVNSERGEGGAGAAGHGVGEDLAFTVSRRKFVIRPFSLPPVKGDQDAQQEAGAPTKKDIEF